MSIQNPDMVKYHNRTCDECGYYFSEENGDNLDFTHLAGIGYVCADCENVLLCYACGDGRDDLVLFEDDHHYCIECAKESL